MDTTFNEKIKKLEDKIYHLKLSIAELSILNEIATAIRSTQSLKQITDLIIHKCVKHLQVEQGAILLLDKNNNKDIFKTMIREIDQSSEYLPYRMDDQLFGWMIKNKEPLLINDYQNDTKIATSPDEIDTIKSILAVPLINRNQLTGLLVLYNKKDLTGFSESDQRLLTIIGTQSAQVIENARLFEEERELLRVQEEMRFARDIQIKLLPDNIPYFDGYDIAALSIPAKDVGGDYYDFIKFSDTKLAFCLGDVSGKGLPAAMLMANLQATLRGQALLKHNPAECMFYSNILLYNSTSPEKFATLFCGTIDASTNELKFTNAGHDYPFLYSENMEIKLLQKGGTILGFRENSNYEEDTFNMEKGEVLFIYSDGLTEAMNKSEKQFGEKKLQELVGDYLSYDAKTIINKTLDKIETFTEEMPQMDDMTVMVIKRLL